jgi:hypothetical protein
MDEEIAKVNSWKLENWQRLPADFVAKKHLSKQTCRNLASKVAAASRISPELHCAVQRKKISCG